MNIDLPIYDNRNNSFETSVRAEIVDIAPHLAGIATFAVHRSAFGEFGWRVSNIETGARICLGCETRSKAIRDAELRLATKTLTEAALAMRRFRRAHFSKEWVRHA